MQDDGEDEIKRKQLKDLAILNGTLRPEAPASVTVTGQSSFPPSPSGLRQGKYDFADLLLHILTFYKK